MHEDVLGDHGGVRAGHHDHDRRDTDEHEEMSDHRWQFRTARVDCANLF